MLEIKNNDITLTRGDDAYFRIVIWTRLNDKKLPYVPSENDHVKFYLKTHKCGKTLITKEYDENLQFKMESNDTKYLHCGLYWWQSEITFENGDINTISEGLFLLKEG